jgi:hypothetical protein
LTREEIAERGRQFDIGTDIGERRYGYEAQTAGEREASRREREAEINRQLQGRFDVMRGENIQRLDPYSEAGAAATREQMALMGLSGEEAGAEAMARFQESPGQRFMRERAQKALLSKASAIGGLGGGNVRSALVEQGAGFAAQDYDRQLARLAALGGQGMSAADIQGRGQGFGPGYLTTGTDVGIATSKYTPGGFQAYEGPPGGVTRPDVPTGPIIPPGPDIYSTPAAWDPASPGGYRRPTEGLNDPTSPGAIRDNPIIDDPSSPGAIRRYRDGLTGPI